MSKRKGYDKNCPHDSGTIFCLEGGVRNSMEASSPPVDGVLRVAELKVPGVEKSTLVSYDYALLQLYIRMI